MTQANVAHSRTEPGNIAFDVFQDAKDPDMMVQLERWTNAQTHDANLKRPVIGEIRGVFSQTLAKPLMSHRALLKDVSGSSTNS
ncbi:antibiotic biosynthesis monooxygenase [Robbsia sp. KACC 23696]|uniref:putative quinol monooxygenase n=1 Tax=Robbsia sp. KACC 23696 TaxID=3149231 RepID=UPI00325B561B